MNALRTCRRLAVLSWGERVLLVEAGIALAIAALAIRVLPFRVVARTASRTGATASPAVAPEKGVGALVWAVRAMASRLPWKNVCFQRGLALHSMLRRRGFDSRLHYGVGRLPDHPVSAHVWVSVADQVIEGAEGIAGHVRLASFPPMKGDRSANA